MIYNNRYNEASLDAVEGIVSELRSPSKPEVKRVIDVGKSIAVGSEDITRAGNDSKAVAVNVVQSAEKVNTKSRS